MQITIQKRDNTSITLEVESTDIIRSIKEKIQLREGIQIDQQILILGGQLLEDALTLAHYNINEQTTLRLALKKKVVYSDNIKDGLLTFFENDNKQSEFLRKIKENELNVNLIHFDLKIKNKENYEYFNNFKINVVGDYHNIDDLSDLKECLEQLQYKNIPYIVISSGSSGKDVIPICLKFPFVKEVIIFCGKYEYNKHYLQEYPGYVKKVLININQVYEYIKTFGDEFRDGIENYMEQNKYIYSSYDYQFQPCPIISSYEYDKFYFLVHKINSEFFGDINNINEVSIFKEDNLNKIFDYLSQLKFEDNNEKNIIKEKFMTLVNLNNNNQFIEQAIKLYTSDNSFYYLFNRAMRNFGKGIISLSNFIGPFLYGLNKYVKDNPSFAITKKVKLSKIIKCSKLDFSQYKLNLGHIICLTSFTLTTSANIKYKQRKSSKEINDEINNKEMMIVRLKFKYFPENGSLSPGVIIENKKIKEGKFLFSKPKDKEVILFPFTFAKITEIKDKNEGGAKIKVVKFNIINRKSYIEYILKNDVEKRILFNQLEEQ